ncbi:serine protease [Tropicimonas isoalkanivorans]|uniref:Putative peptidoglycan binding domain-containing protein n=1 Tax=Tropicimonas isoalkanivorans TaxID=441112 RepID=A0A1I1NLD1_9RHOB|nr:serine protease [Tropicimonas isoalkanivorans]SFC98459.1 Putative peptidoglycan binding domain-containing protein [Tropicimonas isoalkanivorans]
MKTFFLIVLTCMLCGAAPGARAQQETAWVQIEAVRTLALAQERVQAYARALPDLAGFRTSAGWYAIALGPYTRATAESELRALRGDGLIPSDSYIATSGQYQQQFWPEGGSSLAAAPKPGPSANQNVGLQQQTAPQPDAQPATPATPRAAPDQTPAEARASERSLLPQDRQEVQEALQWEGHYQGAIDGAFGPGTRNAMASWQTAQGHDATGVLTTGQRAALIKGYRDAFAGLGLASVRDDAAGIEMILPTGKVDYARTEAPFVHYDSTDDDGVRVLLISQSGNEATLFGLYDIMQTLEIVPLSGFRERKGRSFVLTGQSARLHSYTFAQLADGAVKGFTMIWKPGDEKVMQRVVQTMRNSFTPIPGIVLPDTATTSEGADQQIDLLAGLELRRPERSRSGFYVDDGGSVLTTTDVLAQCSRLTIGEEVEADVSAQDESLGLALLKPRETIAPIAVAEFRPDAPRLNTEVALAGFSYEDALSLPVLTYGKLADVRGLGGEDFVDRLDLSALPGDIGGPVFDQTGSVLGMLRASEDGARQLPPDVSFSVDVPAIAGFLDGAGVSPRASERMAQLAPEDLTTLASDVTVRISCWN